MIGKRPPNTSMRTLVHAKAIALLLLCMLPFHVPAQSNQQTPLFSDDAPLALRLNISIRELRKVTNDSTYMDQVQLHFQDQSGVWDSIKVQLRTRGHFRLKECFFPPLRIKIKKKQARGTVFEGNKALKLVLPCYRGGNSNAYIVKEFLCYKLFETVTPYTFSTRLVELDLRDESGNKTKNHQLTAFLIEDDDLVAARFGAKVRHGQTLHPLALHDTSAIRHDLFQYLISNIDWSTTHLHNEKIMLLEDPMRYVPLAYDFDQSGFVDAPYAVVRPEFGMSDVHDRVYRGFCRKDTSVVQFVRRQFLQQEEVIFEVIDSYKNRLEKKDFNSIHQFVSDFFEIMKSDKQFQSHILDNCRTR
jgi:hypothetical protein